MTGKQFIRIVCLFFMERIAVLGTGKMAAELLSFFIAQECAIALWGRKPERLKELSDAAGRKIERQVRAGIMTPERGEMLSESLLFSTELSEVIAGRSIIIESVKEELSVKEALYKRSTPHAGPDAIWCTNSSSILPQLIHHNTDSSLPLAGLHFFFPLRVKEVVEFIVPEGFPTENIQRIKEFMERCGKKVFMQEAKSAFLLNRIWLGVQIEALHLLHKGHTAEEIDEVVKSELAAHGVFEMMDAVGFDTLLAAVENYKTHFLLPDDPEILLEELRTRILDNQFGQKNGTGFYSYIKGRRQHVNEINVDADNYERIKRQLLGVVDSTLLFYQKQTNLNKEDLYEYFRDYAG